jgi:uncharacterized paraquat-inducible protein A
MSVGARLGLAGSAVVVCVHDRPKREVTTEAQVAELGRSIGHVYDPVQHKLWSCSCCENLFVDPSDEPRYCRRCQSPFAHAPAGPLQPPNQEPV